ncbi:MAG: hypothetical protein ACR2IK_03900 [Chloroflexota bacterium]
MNNEICVLGATGRVGRAVAKQLQHAGVSIALAGRDRERLEEVAASVGGAPRLVVGSLDAVLADLTRDPPSVVINTVGPFTATAITVARACPVGTHYVDVANELPAVQGILALDREAADSGRVFVTGAGFGVLATESTLLHLCEGHPPASRVRVDAVPSLATEPGVIGSALAHSIVDNIPSGGWEVRNGRLASAPVFGKPTHLTTPDGDMVASASIPSGELLAAWRASKAAEVVAASSVAPTSAAVRLMMPAVSAVFHIPGVAGFAARRLERVKLRAQAMPRKSSWAHARAEWSTGLSGKAGFAPETRTRLLSRWRWKSRNES